MISCIIPWRHNRERFRQFKRVQTIANDLADEVILADDGLSPFSRGAAINAGVRQAKGSILWILDADLIVPTEQLDEAILMARNYGSVVLPYDIYHYHSRISTRLYLKGHMTQADWFAEKPMWTMDSIGGTAVMVRDTWEIVGGFDERMRGWGHEDNQFWCAAMTYAAVDRVPGVLHHLWHPDNQPRPQANAELAERYTEALGDPVAMDKLIGER